MQQQRIVTRDEWIAARKELLVKEKALTRAHDALAAERRQLPMVKVETNYTFDTPAGKRTLAELFDGRSQLMIYHFMMGPDWSEGCASCSFLADGIDGSAIHARSPRRHAHGSVTRAAREHPGVQDAHGLAVSVGLVLRQQFQRRFLRLVHQ